MFAPGNILTFWRGLSPASARNLPKRRLRQVRCVGYRNRPQNRRDFAAALRAGPAIISEIKKASPSKGVLSAGFPPRRTRPQLRAGWRGGAVRSTDRDFFQGSTRRSAQSPAPPAGLPVLRKDFTIAEYHVVEAAAAGADAILLIAAILDEVGTSRLPRTGRRISNGRAGRSAQRSRTRKIRCAPARKSLASTIATCGRFRSRSTHQSTSLRRFPRASSRSAKAEFSTRNTFSGLAEAGYDAFLVGERLVRSENATRALKELVA